MAEKEKTYSDAEIAERLRGLSSVSPTGPTGLRTALEGERLPALVVDLGATRGGGRVETFDYPGTGHLFTDPSLRDIIYAAVVAMLAYAGIEAASDLAPDIEVSRRDLKRIASLGAIAVPLVYAGMAAIALMALYFVAGTKWLGGTIWQRILYRR